jgi:hypothetical protein
LTEDEKRRFIISDNISGGTWDVEDLVANWDRDELDSWGLELDWQTEPSENEESQYTQKVATPVYEPKNEKPEIKVLFDSQKYKDLIKTIEDSSAPNDIKDFLKVAASRHIVFNYENIADFYAHSDQEVQALMEQSALVIIDFNKAIEYGYTRLSEQVAALYGEEYPDEE